MIKLLHSPFLLVFLLITTIGFSQSTAIANDFLDEHVAILSLDAENLTIKNDSFVKKKEFSYNNDKLKSTYQFLHEDHDHADSISFIDIISSDEGTDFNCSGGFCMNELHFHKKGLTLKKQFFGYFMSISC